MKTAEDHPCAGCGHPKHEHKVRFKDGMGCIAIREHAGRMLGMCMCNRYEPRPESETEGG